jgi:uncharacterized cupin superfamily protein
VHRPGVGFYLKIDRLSTWNPPTDVNPAYIFLGVAGWVPIVGDWDGNGITKIGVYKDASWYLDYDGNGMWSANTDKECPFPAQFWSTPVVGDWNGDGRSKVGYYRWGYWSLDYLGVGTYSTTYNPYTYPNPDYEHTPVVGDWNGDRKTEIGVYNSLNGDWNLDFDRNGEWWNSGSDKWYNLGGSGWIPVVGDWNGDGTTKMGVYRATEGTWRLDYYGNGSVIKAYSFGTSGSTPIIGDWNGDGKSKIGVYNTNNGDWNLDYDGNGLWDATADKVYNIGVGTPVVGKWS